MINRVVLVGRLTKDPELKYTPSGVPMARFTVAVNRTTKKQDGEQEADFIGCIAWRKQAESLANFMRKGGLIGVDGRIQTGSYEGNEGKKIYTTDVVADSIQFLEPKNQNQQGQGRTQPPQHQQQQYQQQPPMQQQQNYGQQMYGQQQQYQQPYQQNQQPYNPDNDLPFR